MSNTGKREKNAWLGLSEPERNGVFPLCKEYLEFLNTAKTERETVAYLRREALKNGFVLFQEVDSLAPGQKIFMDYKGKAAIALVVGEQPLDEGFNLVASHVDTPRIDLKGAPLYENAGMALFKTHYYGGIKKYQWPGMPLAMHGVVVKKNGQIIEVNIGEAEDDPVFTITDLLVHLAKDQMEKKMSEGITGEDLNILVGSLPLEEVAGDEGQAVKIKEAISKILCQRYDIEDDDFTSAEIQMVPAIKAREIGFDRSLIGGYGQDDRVCVFTSFKALLEVSAPQRTALCVFADKEEIGSVGNTGLRSFLLENVIADLFNKSGGADYYRVMKALRCSCALSADVNGALDPNYEQAFDKLNSALVGRGVCLTKYTGSRGKSESNDAHPEYLARVRCLFDDNGVIWQIGELGKVDQGGGGTVAHFLSRFGMDVVDCGVALLGMHSPFEVASKADVYSAYKAYRAFMQEFK
ncbi:MAG: aminopeptidase [Syntrophomonadaceae bacterium]|nr:aminopeptidase [Syntrophomonadaceae bacterium]